MSTYEIRKSPRAKHVRITVKSDSSVIVTIPRMMSEEKGRTFAESKREWIEKALVKIQRRPAPLLDIPKGNARDYKKYKEDTLALVRSRLEHFNAFYKLAWKNVSIKNTSSRWGSCSKQGNLNFNYRLALLPEAYADYIVVHELCHLEEFNHSAAFWKLVEKTMPQYRELRRHLRNL